MSFVELLEINSTIKLEPPFDWILGDLLPLRLACSESPAICQLQFRLPTLDNWFLAFLLKNSCSGKPGLLFPPSVSPVLCLLLSSASKKCCWVCSAFYLLLRQKGTFQAPSRPNQKTEALDLNEKKIFTTQILNKALANIICKFLLNADCLVKSMKICFKM